MSDQRRTDPDDKRSSKMPDMAETNDVKIDFSQIPDHVRDELASATLNAVTEFIRQPGGREFLDNKKALKKAKKEAQ
jgi:hypothetical protein